MEAAPHGRPGKRVGAATADGTGAAMPPCLLHGFLMNQTIPGQEKAQKKLHAQLTRAEKSGFFEILQTVGLRIFTEEMCKL